jgi:hypothetical protein
MRPQTQTPPKSWPSLSLALSVAPNWHLIYRPLLLFKHPRILTYECCPQNQMHSQSTPYLSSARNIWASDLPTNLLGHIDKPESVAPLLFPLHSMKPRLLELHDPRKDRPQKTKPHLMTCSGALASCAACAAHLSEPPGKPKHDPARRSPKTSRLSFLKNYNQIDPAYPLTCSGALASCISSAAHCFLSRNSQTMSHIPAPVFLYIFRSSQKPHNHVKSKKQPNPQYKPTSSLVLEHLLAAPQVPASVSCPRHLKPLSLKAVQHNEYG